MTFTETITQITKIVRAKPRKTNTCTRTEYFLDEAKHLTFSQEEKIGIPDLELDTLIDCILKDPSGRYLDMMKDILVLAKIEFGTKVESKVSKCESEWKDYEVAMNHRNMIYEEKLSRWKEQPDEGYFIKLIHDMIDDAIQGKGTEKERKVILGTITRLSGQKDWSNVRSRRDLGDGTLTVVDGFKRHVTNMCLRELKDLGLSWSRKLDLE